MKRILLLVLTAGLALQASAQEENSYVHEQSDGYQWPTDPAVLSGPQTLRCLRSWTPGKT